MKILVVSAAFPPMRAGDAEHCLYLCRHLTEAGHDVHVVTTKRDLAGARFPFTLHPVMMRWSWREIPRLLGVLKRISPDAILLIHASWLYHFHPMVTFLPALAKRVVPRVRFVTLFEILWAPWEGSLLSRIIRKGMETWVRREGTDYTLGTLLRDSDGLVVLSGEDLKTLSQLSPEVLRKGIVIPPPPLLRMSGLDPAVARQRGRQLLGLGSETFALGFFGYVDPVKGLETLVEALGLLRKKGKNISLVMIGGGRSAVKTEAEPAEIPSAPSAYKGVAEYEAKIHELVKARGLEQVVVWTPGYDSDSDQASLYLHAMDACALPFDRGVTLRRSSFSAACAHGLPIVTTRGEALEAEFVDRTNVLLCPPKSPEKLAEAVELLMATPQLRDQLQKGALELSRQSFSWESCYEKLAAAFSPRSEGGGSHV